MNGRAEIPRGNSTLVIGVHREELGFGIKVAPLVDPFIRILRIDNGLNHEKKLYRSGFYHSKAHREMYLQLHQQLKGKTALVIDLHTGINEPGRCADILSADVQLLGAMNKQLDMITRHPLSRPGAERLYQIIPHDEQSKNNAPSFPACHTIIPRKIWDGRDYIYVGLEIYLQDYGEGLAADHEYAAQLIRMICLTANRGDAPGVN